jgi:hypothetical protein
LVRHLCILSGRNPNVTNATPNVTNATPNVTNATQGPHIST